MKFSLKGLFTAVLPLLGGLLCYLLFRPDTYISTLIYGLLGIDGFKFNFPVNVLTTFTRNFVPDICWAVSLFLFLELIFSEKETAAVTTILFAVLTEMLQMTDIMPGTFDVWDIIFETAGVITAYAVTTRKGTTSSTSNPAPCNHSRQ